MVLTLVTLTLKIFSLSELLEVAFRSLESGLDPAATRRAAARSSR
jgi:hypothetical protein